MKYKSSSLTFIFKYLLLPVWTGGLLFGVLFTWPGINPFSYKWALAASLIVAFALIWLIPFVIRLKSVEAHEEHIIVSSLRRQYHVRYTDIEWLYESVLIYPTFISIRFGRSIDIPFKKIYLIPEHSPLLDESDMILYMKDKVIKSNPMYEAQSDPPRWFPVALLIASILLLFIVLTRIIPLL